MLQAVGQRAPWDLSEDPQPNPDFAPPVTGCLHCEQPAITLLDGEYLCQRHADEWARGEGIAAAEMQSNPDRTKL